MNKMYEGIRALTFDFGNTLFDYYSVIYEVFRRTMSRINGETNYSKEEFIESYFRAHTLIPEYLKEKKLKYTQHDQVQAILPSLDYLSSKNLLHAHQLLIIYA